MDRRICMLKIEIDGHLHGSEAPKPWVAEITGPNSKFGLARKFVQPLNDWHAAHRAWSGNVYGRTANFPLREGGLYEVSRLRGRSSKRHVAREFLQIRGGKKEKVKAQDALAVATGISGECCPLRIADQEGRRWVARVTGLGTPQRLGFVVVDGKRLYLLEDGIFEVAEAGESRLVRVSDRQIENIGHREALQWILQNAA